MPRYFFDITDQGRGEPDDEGTIHADPHAARLEAIAAIAYMAKDELPNGNSHDIVVSIRDEGGKVLFRASLMLRAEWVE